MNCLIKFENISLIIQFFKQLLISAGYEINKKILIKIKETMSFLSENKMKVKLSNEEITGINLIVSYVNEKLQFFSHSVLIQSFANDMNTKK